MRYIEYKIKIADVNHNIKCKQTIRLDNKNKTQLNVVYKRYTLNSKIQIKSRKMKNISWKQQLPERQSGYNNIREHRL